jgi:hypothetical protein
LNIARLTEQLAGLYRAGRTYAFIRQAHRVLAVEPEAPELAALTLRALVELGYGGPALELIRLRPDLRRVTAEDKRLESALADLPDRHIPWTTFRTVFEHNRGALLAHRPELADLVSSLPDMLEDVDLYQSLDGHPHVCRRRRGHLREWLPDLSGYEDLAGVQLPPRQQIRPAAVIGLRVQSLIEPVWQQTANLFLTYGHPLYLIEPDLVRWAAWMHYEDHQELLNDERVYLFAGPSALDQFRELLESVDYLPPPQLFIDQGEDAEYATSVRKVSERAQAEVREALDAAATSLALRYEDRDAGAGARRLSPPGPILAVTSRYTTMLQFSTRDTLAALKEMGYETHMLIEDRDHHYMPGNLICRAIEELDPAMIIFLDHLRYEYPFIPKTIPFLTWIQDPMPALLCPEAGESIGPFDFVCGIYKPRCTTEFGYPADRFVPLDVPVSSKLFHDGELDPETQARYACDVSFISNASTPVERFHASAAPTYPDEYRPMLDRIYAVTTEMLKAGEFPTDNAMGLTSRAAEETGLRLNPRQLQHVAIHHAYRVLDWGRRQQSLEWVADWARRTGRTFRIYGRGWENHPTLAAHAAGVIEHGEPLRQACRASRLSLQLIPSGFRHQRSYEILASGSLPLTRYSHLDFASLPVEEYVRRREAGLDPDGERLFPKLERITFTTAGEFEALAEDYLANEAKRNEVLADLRAVVMERCTYDAAMKKVMRAFRERLESSARQTPQCLTL